MEKLTKKQIEDLKAKNGEIYEIEVDGKVCYLRKPSRKVISAAISAGQKDAMKFNEIILLNCWLCGDEEIKTDDTLFMSVCSILDKLIETKEATLKKL